VCKCRRPLARRMCDAIARDTSSPEFFLRHAAARKNSRSEEVPIECGFSPRHVCWSFSSQRRDDHYCFAISCAQKRGSGPLRGAKKILRKTPPRAPSRSASRRKTRESVSTDSRTRRPEGGLRAASELSRGGTHVPDSVRWRVRRIAMRAPRRHLKLEADLLFQEIVHHLRIGFAA
jgi:hypothetical protein